MGSVSFDHTDTMTSGLQGDYENSTMNQDTY